MHGDKSSRYQYCLNRIMIVENRQEPARAMTLVGCGMQICQDLLRPLATYQARL
jgi:hypothetical protein